MENKLPVIKTILDSFLFMKNERKTSIQILITITIYSILLFLIEQIYSYYMAERNTFVNYYTIFSYLSKYFLFYIIIRMYFKITPLWSKKAFYNSLWKTWAIIVLFLATLGFMSLVYYITSFLLNKAVVPEYISENIIDKETLINYSNITILGFIYIVAIFSIIIPSFSWVSSIMDKNKSITWSFLKTNKSYFKMIMIVVIIFCIVKTLENILYRFVPDSGIIHLLVMDNLVPIVKLFIGSIVYLKTYEFFYGDKNNHTKEFDI